MNVPDNLILEALEKVGYDKADYFKIAERFDPRVMAFYMELAFAVGFDKGYSKIKVEAFYKSDRPVQKIDKFGNVLETFDNLGIAADSVGLLNRSNICKAIKRGWKAGGFNWQYAEK